MDKGEESPIAAYFEQFKESLRTSIVSEVESLLVENGVQRGLEDATALDPFKLYRADEAADLLGVERSTMYDIPEAELPRREVGPARGAVRWQGLDLLCYMRGLDPVDDETLVEAFREKDPA